MLCLPAACRAMPCQSELLLVSDYSGCTDQNRPSVNAAGVCSYLRDRMSLSVRHYPLCACCLGRLVLKTDRRAEEGLDPRRG